MSDKPTVYLTNWSSNSLHGPDRKLSIMAAPRVWEHGDGRVPSLTPDVAQLYALREGRITVELYRAGYIAQVNETMLRSGTSTFASPLVEHPRQKLSPSRLRDGDTLLCACSRDRAAAGQCHRVWAAQMLWPLWRVILDGVELPEQIK